jgi:L-iditol 2-dehydrogenase
LPDNILRIVPAHHSAARIPKRKTRGARVPAVLLTGLRRFEVGDVPMPSPRAGEVLIELTAVGICGSDLHYFRIGRIGSQRIDFPLILGHEPAGIIAGMGKGVRGLKEGQRAAVEPAMPCGSCRACRQHRFNLCYHMRFLGSPGISGAFQRYLVMPAECVEVLPERVDEALGCAAEPLGVALHAIELLHARKSDRAAIIGGGPIGLSVAALLRAQGIRVTTLSDPRKIRREIAQRLAVQNSVDPRHFVDATQKATDGYGAEIVFECSGAPDAYDQAIKACCRGGRIAILGINEVDTVNIEPHEWRRREISIVQVRRSNHSLAPIIKLLKRDDLGLRKAGFFSGSIGLAGIQEAFERLGDHASPEVKIIVDPRKC